MFLRTSIDQTYAMEVVLRQQICDVANRIELRTAPALVMNAQSSKIWDRVQVQNYNNIESYHRFLQY